jgi:hypothetical protein
MENAVVKRGRRPAASQNHPFCALVSNQMFIVIDVPTGGSGFGVLAERPGGG